MEKVITKETVRASPAFQSLKKKLIAISILKGAQRFEYKNTVHNDTWIFWMTAGVVVASAITTEFGATLHVHQDDGPGITHNDERAWPLVHLGIVYEKREGEDSGAWALGFTERPV